MYIRPSFVNVFILRNVRHRFIFAIYDRRKSFVREIECASLERLDTVLRVQFHIFFRFKTKKHTLGKQT